jgi:hypothetical protein
MSKKKIQTNWAIRIATETAELRKGVDQATQKLKGFEANIGMIGKTLAAGFSAAAVIEFTKKVVQSSQELSDKWDISMKQMEGSSKLFFSTLASGDFKDFIKDLNNVLKVSKEYSQILDDLGDKARVLKYEEADAKGFVLERMKILRSEFATTEERIKAADEIIQKEDELAEKRSNNSKTAYQSELKYQAAIKRTTAENIEFYLRNYEAQEDLRLKAAELIKVSKEYKGFGMTGSNQANYDQKLAEMKKTIEELNKVEGIQKWVEILEAVPVDEALDKITDLYKQWKDAENSALENTQKVTTRRDSLLAQQLKQLEKLTDEISNDDRLGVTVPIFADKQSLEKLGTAIRKTINDGFDYTKDEVDLTKITNKIEKVPVELTPRMNLNELKALEEQLAERLSDALEHATEEGIASLAAALGEAFSGGNVDLGQTLLMAMANYAQELGRLLIAYAISIESFKKAFANPMAALAAGIALTAIGAAVKSKIAQSNKIKGYASGGVPGSSLYMAGEAGRELIATSGNSRVFSHAQTERMLGENKGTVEFRIHKDHLVGLLNKNNKEHQKY